MHGDGRQREHEDRHWHAEQVIVAEIGQVRGVLRLRRIDHPGGRVPEGGAIDDEARRPRHEQARQPRAKVTKSGGPSPKATITPLAAPISTAMTRATITAQKTGGPRWISI